MVIGLETPSEPASRAGLDAGQARSPTSSWRTEIRPYGICLQAATMASTVDWSQLHPHGAGGRAGSSYDSSMSGVRLASVPGIPSSAARRSAIASSRRIRPATASLVIGGDES
jgi:hypothetical protein